jgi:hypothetical protein
LGLLNREGQLVIGLSLIFAAEVILSTNEPVPAEPWQETFTAQCGDNSLEIVRPIYPSGLSLTVTLNGKDITHVSGLSEVLGERGAAYRMSFVCSQSDDVLTFHWVRGVTEDGGSVAYYSGSVSFDDGAILDVMAGPATEEDFWYR